ncbi:MAG: MFS transporter, partial [Chloroflexota bacterium]
LLRVYPIVASMGVVVCFQGVRMSIVPLLAFIVHTRGYSLTAGATMVAAMGFGMIMISYPVGRLGDRWGRRGLLLLAILVAMACTLLVFWSESMLLMFCSLVLLGAAHGTMVVMSRAIVCDVTGPEERGLALSTLFVAIGVAVVLFPTVASYVRLMWGWRAISVVGGVLLTIALILVAFLRERGVGRWDHNGVLEGAMVAPVCRKGCGEPLRSMSSKERG